MDQLKVQLASAGESADLQTAVLLVGKQMPATVRSVPTQGAVRPMAVQTMASNGMSEKARITQGVVVPTRPNDMASLELGASVDEPDAKAGAVEAETVTNTVVAERPQGWEPETTGSVPSTLVQRVEPVVPQQLDVVRPAVTQGVQVASTDPSIVKVAMSQLLVLGVVRDEDEAEPADGGQKVASTDVEVVKANSASDTSDAKLPAKSVALQIQAGLARVGCYRQTVDGHWGDGSRKALSDYFQHTGQGAQGLEPSMELLGDIFLRSGRICRQPVQVKPAAKVATIEKKIVKQAKGAGAKATNYGSRLKTNQRDPGTISIAIGL